MTRKIRASEIVAGMKICWAERGYGYSGRVDDVRPDNIGGHGESVEVCVDGDWNSFHPEFEVKVLSALQPEEPTAFGACVEAAGKKYVRADNGDAAPWALPLPGGYDWVDWEDICAQGFVMVVNADPFAGVSDA